jgi:hypothetical protein
MGRELVAVMLGPGLGGGRPPVASPAAPAAPRLVGIAAAAKVKDQVRARDLGSGVSAAAQRSGGQANLGGQAAHAASPPLGSWRPRARWRRWRTRSTARSSSTVAGSWRRR